MTYPKGSVNPHTKPPPVPNFFPPSLLTVWVALPFCFVNLLFRQKMALPNSDAPLSIKEFQSLFVDLIQSFSDVSGTEFKNFCKELNKLLGTVHVEWIQLDKIMRTLTSNSPIPDRIATMYEEITAYHVEIKAYHTLFTQLKNQSTLGQIIYTKTVTWAVSKQNFCIKDQLCLSPNSMTLSASLVKTPHIIVFTNFQTLFRTWTPRRTILQAALMGHNSRGIIPALSTELVGIENIHSSPEKPTQLITFFSTIKIFHRMITLSYNFINLFMQLTSASQSLLSLCTASFELITYALHIYLFFGEFFTSTSMTL